MRKLVFGRRVYDVWTAVWLTDDGRPPMAPNDRWSLDFVSDQLTDGRRFRILTVVDDCTRECLRSWQIPRFRAPGWRGNWTG
jgi:hypothetical protein